MKKNIAFVILVAVLLAACATDGTQSGARSREMKLAFDFTDANPAVLLRKLDNVETTRRQLIASGYTPRIVMTFRGNASFFTNANLAAVKERERADALKVAAKLREMKKAPGIESLEQCNLPLADRKLNPAHVMPEVKLVPNGWIALGAYQQQGYAYIAP